MPAARQRSHPSRSGAVSRVRALLRWWVVPWWVVRQVRVWLGMLLLRVQTSCALQGSLITNGRYTPKREVFTLKQSEPILATPPSGGCG